MVRAPWGRQTPTVDPAGGRPLRYGFVGVGMMGVEHVRNVVALPGAEPVAAADPHVPSLEAAVAAAGGSLATYESTEAMVESEELDVVVVSTPNATHRAVLEPLWGRPVHLMVEKPLCTTVEDALAVRAAAAKALGKIGNSGDEVVQALLRQRNDADATVRSEVDRAIVLIMASKGELTAR